MGRGGKLFRWRTVHRHQGPGRCMWSEMKRPAAKGKCKSLAYTNMEATWHREGVGGAAWRLKPDWLWRIGSLRLSCLPRRCHRNASEVSVTVSNEGLERHGVKDPGGCHCPSSLQENISLSQFALLNIQRYRKLPAYAYTVTSILRSLFQIDSEKNVQGGEIQI